MCLQAAIKIQHAFFDKSRRDKTKEVSSSSQEEPISYADQIRMFER